MFPHEKLHVYGKALAFVAAASAFSSSWDKRHAVVDQLDRASESLLLNHRRFLDVAESSAVKVAAYLDLAMQRLSLSPAECDPCKELLRRIVAMLSRM